MSNLNLLMELEKNYSCMEKSKKTLKDESYINFLKELKKNFEEAKKQYKIRENELKEIKKEYKNITLKVKEEDSKVAHMENVLYEETGNNIKLIYSLQEDIKKEKDKITHLDDLSLNLLERDEKISSEKEELLKNIKKIKTEFEEYKESSVGKINKAKKELIECEEKIKELRKSIPEDMLRKFDNIKTKKKVAVASLENQVCLGCRMKVSSITLDKVKNENNLVYCDNCGRILYYDKNNTKTKKK